MVVITSSELEEYPGLLGCYTMAVNETNNNTVDISRIVVKKIDSIASNFTGTGDCSAALLLGWSHLLAAPNAYANAHASAKLEEGESKLGIALLNTIESIQAVLRRTQEKQSRYMNSTEYSQLNGSDAIRAFKAKATELCLIESRFDIMTPPRDIKPIQVGASSSLSPLVNWTESLGD